MGTHSELYTALPDVLVPWYKLSARDLPWRRDTEPYHVWVSEIMLQQTRAEAVRGYYERFLTALPTLFDLAEVEESRLMKLWEGLGYYNRARNLQKAARVILEQYGGEFPAKYADILDLPGIGPYTAGAVASICFGIPAAAVDGNVLRVVSRITEEPRSVDRPEVRRDMARWLEEIYPRDEPGIFTQALMELGAMICTPRTPKCMQCPAKELCLAHAHGAEKKFPVRLPKREKRVEERTVFLLFCDGRLALERRTQPGLLSGLWQFPNVVGTMDARQALQAVSEFGVRPVALHSETHREHMFTHICWHMTAWCIDCGTAAGPFVWAFPEEVRGRYALPTAFRMFLDDIL